MVDSRREEDDGDHRDDDGDGQDDNYIGFSLPSSLAVACASTPVVFSTSLCVLSSHPHISFSVSSPIRHAGRTFYY